MSKALIMVGWKDIPHLDEQTKKELLEAYPESEREARMNGVPVLGSGRVFPVEESFLLVDPFPIPDHWARICGIDFGWDHPGAAAWLAWDRDTDRVYLYDCYRASKMPSALHASAINARGNWIPVAWPHDGLQHENGTGEALIKPFRDHGVNALADYAHTPVPNPKGGPDIKSISVEASIMSMIDAMLEERFKVFKTCETWLSEFRTYHRKDGKIVALADDTISASRYAWVSRRFGITKPSTERRERRQRDWRTA